MCPQLRAPFLSIDRTFNTPAKNNPDCAAATTSVDRGYRSGDDGLSVDEGLTSEVRQTRLDTYPAGRCVAITEIG
jgi:hypothetical protein